MKIETISHTILKIGICRYDTKEYRLFLCTSTYFPGTGDYEDDSDLRNDRELNCYYIWFEDIVQTGKIAAGAGYYLSLSEAIRAAENSCGFEKWLE